MKQTGQSNLMLESKLVAPILQFFAGQNSHYSFLKVILLSQFRTSGSSQSVKAFIQSQDAAGSVDLVSSHSNKTESSPTSIITLFIRLYFSATLVEIHTWLVY